MKMAMHSLQMLHDLGVGGWGRMGVRWGRWYGWGPVQIACLGVEREIFVPARRHNGSEKNLFSHRSSRNYPSMIRFVLTGVIGF